MNRRLLVIATLALAAAVFAGAWLMLERSAPTAVVAAPPAGSALIRPHSPVLGPEDAPVTIVEFFDPACEACRAFHPVLADIRRQHPDEVRIVMRYAAFHDGSDRRDPPARGRASPELVRAGARGAARRAAGVGAARQPAARRRLGRPRPRPVSMSSGRAR